MGASGQELILPGRKRLPGNVDKTSRGMAQTILRVLHKGWTENMWPSYVVDYRPLGMQDDIAVVYHHLAFLSSRGFVLGMKASEAAVREAIQRLERGLQEAQDAQDRDLEHALGTPDDYAQRIVGAKVGLELLHRVLDRHKGAHV